VDEEHILDLFTSSSSPSSSVVIITREEETLLRLLYALNPITNPVVKPPPSGTP
jgi:hypothetical protein